MRTLFVVCLNRLGLSQGLVVVSTLAVLFLGATFAATAQVPSVTFTQTNGVSGVGFTNGVADFSGTGQHLAANSRGDMFIPVSDNNTQYIEEFPATGASPVILFTGLNPTYGGRAVYVDSAGNLFYTYSDQVNYSVDVVYIPFRNGAYPASVSYTSINNSAGQCSAFPVPVTQTTTCRVPLNAPSQYNYYVQSADLGMDGSGNLYMIAKYESTCGTGPCYNSIIKFGTNGVTTIIAQLPNNSGQPELAVSKTGEIYYEDGQGNNYYFAAGSTTKVSLPFYYITGVSIDLGGNVYFTQQNGANGSALIELPYVNGTACQGTNCGNDQYVLSYALKGYTSDASLGVGITGYGVVYYLGDYPNSVNRLNVGSLSFGSTTVATTSGSQTLLLTFGNNNSYKTFGHFTATGPFNVTATTCVNGTTYGPYATSSCTVTLTYSASKPGPQTGSIEAIDSSGNFIGSAQLSGIGAGSTINVDPGTVSSIGGTWTAPSAIAVDYAGNTYVADSTTGSIYKTAAGSSTSTTIATGFNAPTSVAVDGSGNVYVGESNNGGRVIEIALVGTTYSTTKQVLFTGLSGVSGLAADSLGNLYVADSGNARVLLLAPSGNQADGTIVTTIGSGFSKPVALAIDSSNNLYISDAGSEKVYRYAIPTSTLTTVATGLSTAAGIAVDASGSLFLVDSGVKTITHIPNIGGTLTPSKQVTLGTVVTSPNAIAVDSTGNVYVTGSNTTTATPPVTTAAVAEMNRTSGLLQFGNEEETYSTPSSTATVSNGGTASLTFNNPYYTAAGSTTAYALQSSTTCANSQALAVGAACSIAAVFTPPSTGLYNDTLSFSSTPATTSTLLLSGTGVNLPHTTTTITSVTPSSPSYGQTVTVVATVAPVAAGAQPQGTVTFYVDNVAQTPSYAVNSTNGTATIVLTGLTATTHTIVANYSGSTTYAPSASSTYTLVVAKTATTTVVSFGNSVYSNPTSQAPGVQITITGTVTPAITGSLTPSGTVTFYTTGISTPIGSAPVMASGSAFVATLNTTSLQIGTYNIYGVYSGDTNYGTSTSTPPLPLIISNPTILIVPASNTIYGGGSADALTIYSVAGFGAVNAASGVVDFSCSGLPLYSTCAFSPAFAQVTPTAPEVINLSVVINQPPVIAVPGGLDVLPRMHGHPWLQLLVAGIFLFPAALAGFGLRRKKASRLFLAGRMAMIALLLLGSTTIFTGCGGRLTGTYLTPKGTTNLLVSGTISTGALNPPPAQTISLQLIVN